MPTINPQQVNRFQNPVNHNIPTHHQVNFNYTYGNDEKPITAKG